MKYCEFCGNELNDEAKVCPHCNKVPTEVLLAKRSKTKKKVLLSCLAVIVVSVVLVCCFCVTWTISSNDAKDIYVEALQTYGTADLLTCVLNVSANMDNANNSSITTTTTYAVSPYYSSTIRVAYDKGEQIVYCAKYTSSTASAYSYTMQLDYYDFSKQKRYSYNGPYNEGNTINYAEEDVRITFGMALSNLMKEIDNYVRGVTYQQGTKGLLSTHVYYTKLMDYGNMNGDMLIKNKKFKTCEMSNAYYKYELQFDYEFEDFNLSSMTK